jgi:hypothetical protein
VWLVAVAAGAWSFVAYSQTAGAVGAVPRAWPGGSAVSRPGGTPTLVLALHPACSCSLATLERLDGLLAARPGAFEAIVLFAGYDGVPASADVIGPALAQRRHLRRIDDPGAALARRFGALTSGHAVLYDETGRLRFSGGLTRGRGETGDSVPIAYLEAWMAGRRPAGPATFGVFGCALAPHGAAS